jgi:hypothetical protein
MAEKKQKNKHSYLSCRRRRHLVPTSFYLKQISDSSYRRKDRTRDFSNTNLAFRVKEKKTFLPAFPTLGGT